MPASKKISVAFLYDDTLDNSDGVAQYVKRLGEWLSQQGHSVTYLVGDSEVKEWAGGPVVSLSKNLKVSWGGNRLSMSLLPNIRRIKRTLKTSHFDIIHVQVPYSPFMAQLVINRARPQTVVIGTVHIFPANRLGMIGSKLLKIIYGRSLKRFDFMASVSTAAQTYAKEAFKLSTVISPNVVDIKSFDNPRRKSAKKPRVVFLGRLVKRKGCEYLIRAFAEASKSLPAAELIIAGDGPELDRLQKLTAQLNLERKVKFVGFIGEKEKAILLGSAHIACFPSLYGESFGIVLIEAMAAGAGVVLGGNNPGYASVLGTSVPQVIFDPKDLPGFSRLLKEALTNHELALSIHRAQQKQVQQYDVNKVGVEWLKLYSKLIANQRQNRHN